MAGPVLTVEPIRAASVIVVRDAPLEVLMLRRNPASSFTPGAWVFPGGIAEEDDLRVTAARETMEEAGVTLDPESLVRTSRWITPVGLPKRFDTDFFIAKVERDVDVKIDNNEIVDWMWIAPADALARRDLNLVFPTIKNLQAIAGFTSADELLASRKDAVIEAITPILVDGKPRLP